MKDRRGFTLLEIMIVIAIVGIMAVVATTNFFSWQNHYSGVGFQREFLSRINEAQIYSIDFGSTSIRRPSTSSREIRGLLPVPGQTWGRLSLAREVPGSTTSYAIRIPRRSRQGHSYSYSIRMARC
jgi:prepilin-type N-terminal cleavage/methylation domain-containing protein